MVQSELAEGAAVGVSVWGGRLRGVEVAGRVFVGVDVPEVDGVLLHPTRTSSRVSMHSQIIEWACKDGRLFFGQGA